jgi:hypothetical protein
MQFLKTLLIVFTVGLAVAFAFNNWTGVDIRLWGGLLVDINKPLLLLICFLLGLVPTWLWHKAANWRLKQRLAASERAVADLRATVAAPVVVADPLVQPLAEPVAAPIAPPLIDQPRP